MKSLVAQSFKETHRTFGWIEHEFTIVLSVLHVTLYLYYMLYEISAYIFTQIGYPSLPTLVYFEQTNSETKIWVQFINSTLKLFGLVGALYLAIGSASWSFTCTIIGCLTCLPFVGYDAYLAVKGDFYTINVDDFLLFQTLFSVTLRTIRIFATMASCVSIFHFIFLVPEAGVD